MAAATTGLEPRRWINTSDGPSAGPCANQKRAIDSTGRAPLPASVEPIQSSSRSSARRCTGAGTSSKRKPAANEASCMPLLWVPMATLLWCELHDAAAAKALNGVVVEAEFGE